MRPYLLCKRIRKKISSYIDGELSEDKMLFISGHLKECSGCKKEQLNLLKQDKILKGFQPIEISAGFRERFWQKVSERKKARYKQKVFWLPAPFSYSLVAVFVVVFMATVAVFSQKSHANSTIQERKAFSLGIKAFADLPTNSIEEIYFRLSKEK